MTVLRAVLLASLVFAFLFDLAMQGFSQRQCQHEILLLERELAEICMLRDQLQDSFDASLYLSLFPMSREDLVDAVDGNSTEGLYASHYSTRRDRQGL